MKKTLLILSGLLFLTFGRSFAQTDSLFAPDGAQWWYDAGGNLIGYGNDETQISYMDYETVIGDTMIDGWQAKTIKRETFVKAVRPYDSTVSIESVDSSPIYLHSTPDTVFVYNKNFNRFTPLYVFNVHEGDTVCLPIIGDVVRGNHYDHGDSTFCFIIDSIRMTRYDTTYLETFYEHTWGDPLYGSPLPDTQLTPTYNWAAGVNDDHVPVGRYARTVGSGALGLLPTYFPHGIFNKPTIDTTNHDVTHLYGFTLRCYEDSSVSIHIDTSALNGCFYDLTYDTPSAIVHVRPLSELLTVYPNPAHEVIHVRAQGRLVSAGTLLLTDVSGRLLRQIPWRKGQREATVPVSGLAKGFYFLKFQVGKNDYVQKLIISSK